MLTLATLCFPFWLACQITPEIGVLSEAPFDLPRARSLYSDVHAHLSALKKDGPLPLPLVHLHAGRLECKGNSFKVVNRKGRTEGCAFIKRELIVIFIKKDDPTAYVPLLVRSLDYAGNLYLTQDEQNLIGAGILGKVRVGDLK